MKVLRILLIIVEAALLLCVFALFAYQFRFNARLSSKVEATRPATPLIQELELEHDRLVAADPERAKAVRLEEDELARFRVQVKELKWQAALANQTGARLKDFETRANLLPATSGMLAPASLRNVGLVTTSLAWQTRQWAIINGETSVLAASVVFESDVQASLERIFGDLSEAERKVLGSPERMAAKVMTMFNSSTVPLDNMVGFPRQRIVSETQVGLDSANLVTESQDVNGRIVTWRPRMRRFPDGWKQSLVLPADVLKNLPATIKAMPPVQREWFMNDR